MKKIWTKNYPKGVIEDVNMNQYSSFVDLFNESFKKFSDDIAFENMGKSITYKELDKLSKNFSNFLIHELKLKKGDMYSNKNQTNISKKSQRSSLEKIELFFLLRSCYFFCSIIKDMKNLFYLELQTIS